ncbi:MAG: calcium-translocating P-type ATPase, PMCA-type [Clostridia bacterium]|nr:calcium-translocating P-type ATPase, PMCA-type [Clostridia bacterium]MBQ9774267.1 calcium-translocating P-type ATPase, PMCA-type [Clostridia bacterium]
MKDTQVRAEAQGLSDAEVERSRREHGRNELSRQKQKSFLRQFLSNLNDPVIRILLGALAVNLLLLFRDADWVETAGIAVAVFLAALISTLSEHGSAKAFARLSEQSANGTCHVRRAGRVRAIPYTEVVVGDVVLLSAGEQIPADGRMLGGALRADQSAMTGESREVRKYPFSDRELTPESPCALFRGCTVTEGSGEMLVTAVGDATFLGEISREIQQQTRESPLKLRLSKLARQISILGYFAAALVALVYLFNAFFLDSGMQRELIYLKITNPNYLFTQLFHAFTLGLTVLVTSVPEGLPMMVAVVLSSNIKRMVRDKVLVRKPVGIEAAGSMDILFTDKTGTLTEGRMRVSSILLPDGKSTTVEALAKQQNRASSLIPLLFRYGSEATVGDDGHGNTVALGSNATARALLEAVIPLPASKNVNVRSRLPFDSTRKFAAVSLFAGERLTLVLGAPEVLFPFMQEELCADDRIRPFSRSHVEKQVLKETRHGGRVLALALSREGIDASRFAQGVQGALLYLGAVTLRDPVRAEAAHSVAQLQDAGIQVVMITGDSRDTAQAIARQAGILTARNDLILSGEELSRLSDAKLSALLPRLAVVARALPSDKSRLVRLSQEAGRVAGMTGDGINDAPALRRADIGFAMGSGTQVAKDAGDIIILDNNLASIACAVLYGRGIFKNIRKFITLQLTMNLCAVGVTMICPFLGIDSPVTVVQMLWINMIMDTLGGLAFAGEAPLPEYMKEPPKKRDEPILNRYMIHQILLLGGFTVALLLFFLKAPSITSAYRTATDRIYLLTAFFALFIFSSVFNCFNARTDRLKITAGLRKNPVFLFIMLAILVIQIGFVYLGGSVLRTAPLLPRELLLTMLLSLSVFPFEIIRKALWRLLGKKGGY